PGGTSVAFYVTGSTDYCTSLKEAVTQVHPTTLPRDYQTARSDTRHPLGLTGSVAFVTFFGAEL
ncbi:MAG: hypothetical protein WB777_22700, partial [Mycobacterium sp.]